MLATVLVLAVLVIAALLLAAALVLAVLVLVVLVLAALVIVAALVLAAGLVLAALVLGPLIASVRSVGQLLHLSVRASERLELKKRRRRMALQKYLPHLFLSSFHPAAFVALTLLTARIFLPGFFCGDVPGPHPS